MLLLRQRRAETLLRRQRVERAVPPRRERALFPEGRPLVEALEGPLRVERLEQRRCSLLELEDHEKEDAVEHEYGNDGGQVPPLGMV